MIHVTTFRVKYDNESGQILASLPLEHVFEKNLISFLWTFIASLAYNDASTVT